MTNNYFKYIFTTAVTTSLIVTVSAQTGSSNIPVAPVTPPALSTYPFVVNFSSSLKNNYIREWIPDEPTTTQNLNIKHRQKTTYLDGLGRTLQTVHLKGHADGYDIVEHHIYDNLGRESVKFLPFTAQATSSFGDVQYNAKMRIEQFYPPSDGELPYGLTEFDNSPLSRPVKTMSPGKNWVGSNRGISIKYDINIEKYLLNGTIPTYYTIKGSYPKFSVNGNNVLQYDGYYDDGELFITRIIDEDGNQGEEIKDKSGKVIIKRQLTNIGLTPFPKSS